ncbi:tetratricopeptide repeat (TPR)-like superfamily protein [Artemisia annua]|uniref:Tetratricopeptide repeat (TPR)-like superfamily protein n=1 Tax=Artemisia annua TaxID=35608 RepID=A0A2U1KXM5_ARTAN|nr:tetratricopeptide repeat (TPR)-like superfamily protein [Artemisia annua]
MEGRFEEAIGVVFDMVGESMSPDLLTYKTIVEGLCREGRVDDAFDLLEEFRNKDSFMNEKTYKSLLNGLHYASIVKATDAHIIVPSCISGVHTCGMWVEITHDKVDASEVRDLSTV